MRKQTHTIAFLAAILIALIWLASAGKLHAASEPVTKVVPFTATTGLDSFPAYRMDFAVNFDGTREGRPTSGDMAGTLEATNDPDAQHLQATLKGSTASQFGLPGTVELYQVNDAVYFQNPQDYAVLSRTSPGEVRDSFPLEPPENGRPFGEILDAFVEFSGKQIFEGGTAHRRVEQVGRKGGDDLRHPDDEQRGLAHLLDAVDLEHVAAEVKVADHLGVVVIRPALDALENVVEFFFVLHGSYPVSRSLMVPGFGRFVWPYC